MGNFLATTLGTCPCCSGQFYVKYNNTNLKNKLSENKII